MFEILSNEDVLRIHDSSLDVLERTGILVESEVLLSTLRKCGASVDSKTRVVCLPRDLVMEHVKKAPKQFTAYGRTSNRDLRIERGKVYARTGNGRINVTDVATGLRRKGIRSDVEACAVLVDALENVHMGTGVLYPSDVPPSAVDLVSFETMLENTDKHIKVGAETARNLEFIVKMAEVVRGGTDEFEKKPLMTLILSPVSPLVWDNEAADLALCASRHKLPVNVEPAPISGSTAPVTLAGHLVLANAETLAGITILQILNPGNSIYYSPRFTTMDMRTGDVAFGSIENELMDVAAAQMARYYDVPVDVEGVELYLGALAGINVIGGIGSAEAGLTQDIAQTVLDDEILGTILRMLRGIEISPETLAVDVIGRVRPGGNFLGDRHTITHYTKEHYLPQLLASGKVWERALISLASNEVKEKAKEKAREILKRHEPPRLDLDIVKKLRSIVDDAVQL
jgi:trimethylamine--corrinoid protein Co-methyltransferase